MTADAEARHRMLQILGVDVEARAWRRPHPGQKWRHGWIPVAGLAAILQRSGDVTADAARVFGGRFGGVEVHVRSAAALDGGLRVVVGLKDRWGRRAGSALRRIARRDGQLVALHDLRLDVPKQPKVSRALLAVGGPVVGAPLVKDTDTFSAAGFLQAYDAHLDGWYRAAGVSLVETQATGDTSFYWALRGDQQWSDGVPAAIVARLRHWAVGRRPIRRAEARRMLSRIDAGEVPSPYELAAMVSGGDLFDGIPWTGVRRLDGEV